MCMQKFLRSTRGCWDGTTITNFSAHRQFANVCVHAFPPSSIVLLKHNCGLTSKPTNLLCFSSDVTTFCSISPLLLNYDTTQRFIHSITTPHEDESALLRHHTKIRLLNYDTTRTFIHSITTPHKDSSAQLRH